MKPTEPAGRIAFSNYILMTIVATFIFNGNGLGLYKYSTKRIFRIIKKRLENKL